MAEKLNLSTLIPAEPEKVYLAWLDSAGHTAITGSLAKIDGRIGGKFTAWDGYIEGTTLELQPFSASCNPGALLNFRTQVRIRSWKCCLSLPKMVPGLL